MKVTELKGKCYLLLAYFYFFSIGFSSAQENISYWEKININSVPESADRTQYPSKYLIFRLNLTGIKDLLKSAPLEYNLLSTQSKLILSIPGPDGELRRFRMVESSIMEPGLANRFPEFKTYSGQGIEHPEEVLKISLTELGFHGMVLSPFGNFFIDPLHLFNTSDYLVYYRSDLKAYREFNCEFGEEVEIHTKVRQPVNGTANRSNGTNLRTYRLALACTGEYAATKGGTVSGALSGMIASMTRVNGIYETELSIHMNLVANNTSIIYTDAINDPYTNSSGSTMLTENQNNLTTVIGSANYDIGHVFSTGGGGIATLNSPCSASNKARGVTGLPNPVGDAFDVDYVAHEMGHQFGAHHTFNSSLGSCSGNRTASAAYEPGSGITIMAYAGICSTDDLAVHSIAYFHTYSFDEIYNFSVTGSGNGCAVSTLTGNNLPVVTPLALNYTIPINTPFTLTATGSDADNDPLTYSWEEFDIGASGTWKLPVGDAPILRPYPPTTSTSRTFPSLTNILNNDTTPGEILPSYARTLKFRVTARDNRAGGGGVTYNDNLVNVQVINTTTPFRVTSPNTAVIWTTGSTQTVTWDVSSTTNSPISCASVKISLSIDGGLNFTNVLLASTANDGSEVITVPSTTTSQARIKVEAVGNIFFDISNVNFIIQTSSPVLSILNTNIVSPSSLCSGQTVNIGFSGDGPADGGNKYIVQLSNSSGSFSNPDTIGSLTSSLSSGSVSCIIPALNGTGYRVRVMSSFPSLTGSTSTTILTLNNVVGNAGSVSGPTNVCPGQTGVVYSIPPVSNANTYTWSLPSGVSITSGNLTPSITVTFAANASSGVISVTPSNACFTGSSSTPVFNVNVNTTSAAGIISGPESVCKNSSGNIYSVNAINNASSYVWTIPSGASINGASNGNSISVTFGSVTGNITVAGVGVCSTGAASSLLVNVLATPVAPVIAPSGATNICFPSAVNLSFTPTPGLFYQWRKNGIDIPSANGSIYTASQSGSYDVTVVDTLTFSNPNSVGIPDNNCNGAFSAINVGGYTVAVNTKNIYVRMNITHTWDGDLSVFLAAPNGDTLGLVNLVGSSGDNFTNTVFADSGTVQAPAASSNAPYSNLYKPWTSLFTVTGCSNIKSNKTTFNAIAGGSIVPNGTWKLIVVDKAAQDSGLIVNWSITFPKAKAICSNVSNAINVTSYTPAVISGYVPSSEHEGATILINGSGFTGITAINFNGTPTSFTFINDNQISTIVPYGAVSGSVNITTTACGNSSGPLFTVLPNSVNLTLRAFIQGFYTSNGHMVSIIGPGLTDSISIELHQPTFPYGTAYISNGLLDTNGYATIIFPAAVNGSNYFIVFRHRNSIETWSKIPKLFSSTTTFDFTAP